MKKYIFIISALFFAATATAQDDISKQMEVTKAYTPKVGRADKLPVAPRMIDTVQLRPQIEYSITPTAWQTSFSSTKYNPASISVVPFEKNHPIYLRAGVGYPLQSTADLYFNPYMGNKSTLGLFFNHRGSYSKIENSLGVKSNSTEMLNGVGLYGSKHFRRYKLEGDIEYDNRLYNAYGVDPSGVNIINTIPWDDLRINYGHVRGNIGFGDTFTNMNRFNFRVGLNTGFSHSLTGHNQLDVDFSAQIGQMFRQKHGFEVSLYNQSWIGLEMFYNYSTTTVLSPSYILSLNKFTLRAGVKVYYVSSGAHAVGSNGPSENNLKIAPPQIEAVWNIGNGYFTPYLKAHSQMINGGFEALSRKNPYLFPGTTAQTGWRYDARIGFKGGVKSIFSYHLYGGASWLQNYHAFYNVQTFLNQSNGGVFDLAYDDGMLYTAGAELELAVAGGFSASLGANLYSYKFEKLPSADGLPNYDVKLGLSYSYRDKFKISAGLKLIGERDFLYWIYSVPAPADITNELYCDRIPLAIDVSLSAEVKLLNNLWMFVEGNNLANQKLYPYNYYRGLGANVMIGIKTVF